MTDGLNNPTHCRHGSIARALERAAHFLPAQAPLGAFVHHNTLHAFEHLDFHEAVRSAHDLFGARAYMPDEWFRARHHEGRITDDELGAVIGSLSNARDSVVGGVRVADVYLAAIVQDLRQRSPPEIDYERVELAMDGPPHSGEAWRHCLTIAEATTQNRGQVPLRDRDALLAATGVDSDALIHPVLIRLLGAFVDAGLAYWTMPGRQRGFYPAVRALGATRSSLPAAWMRDLREVFAEQASRGLSAVHVVAQRLEALSIGESDEQEFFTAQLLALRGWAGMVSHLEATPSHRLVEIEYSLMDYLAVRLTLERFAVAQVARDELGFRGPECQLRGVAWASLPKTDDVCNRVEADRLERLVRALGMASQRVCSLTKTDATALLSMLDGFDEPARGAVWQEAYERHHRHEVLDRLAHVARKQRPKHPTPAQLQVLCCIDDREESLRRHIEEQGSEYETFGVAGFYGLAIAYRGLMAAHPVPLCPASMRPTHRIFEVPDEGEDAVAWRRRWGLLSRTGFAGHVGSRTMLRGLGFSVAGFLEAGPMLLRTVAPRAAHRWRRRLRNAVIRAPRTRLTALRDREDTLTGALPIGYTLEEATHIIAKLFASMGLTTGFAPLVVVLGHGSTSMNNPHEAAHECGACSGNKGGPNARLFAELANHPEVRAGLVAFGISIPDGTWFVGGIHDTSDDAVDLSDLHRVPESHAQRLADAVAVLDRARTLDAHERCRRFASISLAASPRRALKHVQGRAQFHGEPRPEYGHCTNAICIVGRRWLSRGLFLDRRAFLVSYDPTRDSSGEILQATLASVGPVGAGISLEYYFSSIDQEQYGSGTKLPHNVTGLVGVMNGHQSDLKTGLPHQMIDIHEPLRLLTIVEATPARLEAIAQGDPGVGRLVGNRWIQLVAMDPETLELWEFTQSGFHRYTPRAGTATYGTSRDYYAGHREHLSPVAIRAGVECHG